MHPYHLAQLRALCAEHPIGRKVIFVPSRQIGYNIGQALAASGRPWVNLHLTTPVDWADRLVGPRIRAAGWRPLVQDADLFLVQSLVRRLELPTNVDFASTGVARSFLTTLRALRGANLSPARVEKARLRNGAILAPMYRAYCDWMSEHKLFDQAHLFAEAAEIGDQEHYALVGVFDELALTHAAALFVSAIAGGRPVRVGRRSYSGTLPQSCAGRRFADVQVQIAPDERTHSPADILSPDHLATADSIALRDAVGVENEVRGVLRELLRLGESLDRIEVAYTREDPYLPLLISTADRFEIPVTVAAGLPITCTRSGQALLSFFRWIAGGYAPADFVRMCKSRLVDTDSTFGVTPERVGHIVEVARVGRGQGAYSRALARYEQRLSARLENGAAPDANVRSLERVRKVQSVMKRLSDICPDRSPTSLRELGLAGIAFLREFAPKRRTERDATAAESLRDRLDDLAAGPEFSGEVGDVALTLVELLSEHKFEASVARPGQLYLVPLERAGYSGRERLVVVGMAETSFPGVAIEDPILLDDERQMLSDELRIERVRSSDGIWHLERVLAMAPGKVTLVSNRRTLADSREVYPSAIFQDIAERLNLKERPIYYSAPEADDALDESELALAVRHCRSVQGILERDRPWLANGLAAQHARSEAAMGRFNGWLGKKCAELRPGGDETLSASRLEDLAACPYRYFLKYVLRVRPPDVPEETPGRWLTPLEFGSLLHGVLREFMTALVARGERIDIERHKGLLETILERQLEAQKRQTPVVHEAGYRVDVSRLRRAARIFLNEESRREAAPIGFEVSFGLGEADGFSRPEPVKIKLSDSVEFSLRGSIDRIDRSGESYEVWDYKTGSTYDFDEFDLLSGGRRLQWALYAFALEEILADAGVSGRVSRAGYFFTSDREHGLRISQPPPAREKVAERLESLFDLVSEGAFLHIQKSEACTFCDYHGVCASERRGSKDMNAIRESTSKERPFLESLERWMAE